MAGAATAALNTAWVAGIAAATNSFLSSPMVIALLGSPEADSSDTTTLSASSTVLLVRAAVTAETKNEVAAEGVNTVFRSAMVMVLFGSPLSDSSETTTLSVSAIVVLVKASVIAETRNADPPPVASMSSQLSPSQYSSLEGDELS